MSAFVTKLAVDLEGLKALLPGGAFLEGVSWNGQEVELRWSHRELVTPVTCHTDYPVEALKGKKLPPGVKYKKYEPQVAPGAAAPVTHVRTPGGKAVAVPAGRGKGRAA